MQPRDFRWVNVVAITLGASVGGFIYAHWFRDRAREKPPAPVPVAPQKPRTYSDKEALGLAMLENPEAAALLIRLAEANAARERQRAMDSTNERIAIESQMPSAKNAHLTVGEIIGAIHGGSTYEVQAAALAALVVTQDTDLREAGDIIRRRFAASEREARAAGTPLDQHLAILAEERCKLLDELGNYSPSIRDALQSRSVPISLWERELIFLRSWTLLAEAYAPQQVPEHLQLIEVIEIHITRLRAGRR